MSQTLRLRGLVRIPVQPTSVVYGRKFDTEVMARGVEVARGSTGEDEETRGGGEREGSRESHEGGRKRRCGAWATANRHGHSSATATATMLREEGGREEELEGDGDGGGSVRVVRLRPC